MNCAFNAWWVRRHPVAHLSPDLKFTQPKPAQHDRPQQVLSLRNARGARLQPFSRPRLNTGLTNSFVIWWLLLLLSSHNSNKMKALVRSVASSFAQALTMQAPAAAISLEKAREQHAAYVACLQRTLGSGNVIQLPADDRHPGREEREGADCFQACAAVLAVFLFKTFRVRVLNPRLSCTHASLSWNRLLLHRGHSGGGWPHSHRSTHWCR